MLFPRVSSYSSRLYRSLPDSVLLLDAGVRDPPVLSRGLRGSVHRQGRHVSGRTARTHLQGGGLLRHHDGLPRERLLYHRGHVDPILPLQLVH